MNQTIYEQFRLSSQKGLFMFIFLVNEPSSSPSLGSISKRIKLKHNNIFVNMRLDINIYNIYYMITYINKIYLYRIDNGLCMFINKFQRYQISNCNLLII